MKFSKDVNIKNKRATFDYNILETFTAGIVLTGTEIKSIRLGKAGLTDTYCYVTNGEVWVKNMYIAEYFYGTYNNHEQRRDRKLLLNRKEIRRLEKDGKEAGFTIVPLKLFSTYNKNSIVKHIQSSFHFGGKIYMTRCIKKCNMGVFKLHCSLL